METKGRTSRGGCNRSQLLSSMSTCGLCLSHLDGSSIPCDPAGGSLCQQLVPCIRLKAVHEIAVPSMNAHREAALRGTSAPFPTLQYIPLVLSSGPHQPVSEVCCLQRVASSLHDVLVPSVFSFLWLSILLVLWVSPKLNVSLGEQPSSDAFCCPSFFFLPFLSRRLGSIWEV
jgi:hypothetical protein